MDKKRLRVQPDTQNEDLEDKPTNRYRQTSNRPSAFDIPDDLDTRYTYRLAKRTYPGSPFPDLDDTTPVTPTAAPPPDTQRSLRIKNNHFNNLASLYLSAGGIKMSNPTDDPNRTYPEGASSIGEANPLRPSGLDYPLYTTEVGREGATSQRLETMDMTLINLLMSHTKNGEANDLESVAIDRVDHQQKLSQTLSRRTTTRRGGPRLTIFSEEFLRQLEARHGRSDMKKMLNSATGFLVQTVVFFVMVMFLGMTPIVKESALWDPVQGKKVQNFIPQTPYVMHFGMSVLIANFASWLAYGKVGLKDCWDCRSVLYVSRVSVFYAVGESMELFTLLFIDGTSWKILNQLKLPITAMINYFFLNRKQTETQWALISGISLAIVGYCLAMNTISESHHDASVATVSPFGIMLGVVNVLIVTFAGTIADHTYKEVKYPFFILVAQGRLSACFITFLTMIAFQIYSGNYNWFFHNWNFRVVFLTAWLLAKDWSVTFVLKNLDSMWKALGTAMGLCVTYIMANLIIRYSLNLLVFSFVLSVVINIVAYTLTKREQMQVDREVKTLQKNIADQQIIITDLQQRATQLPTLSSTIK